MYDILIDFLNVEIVDFERLFIFNYYDIIINVLFIDMIQIVLKCFKYRKCGNINYFIV